MAVRDAAHRVGDVAIKAREEAEPVLAGQIAPAVGAGAFDREAPGLAAGGRQQLVDLDVEAALDQFVGSTQPCDASAEDDDLVGHGPRPRTAADSGIPRLLGL